MEIHFYEHVTNIPKEVSYYQCWYETEKAIKNMEPYIVTTQMALMNTRLIESGYKIFVHSSDGNMYEIKLGKNTCTDKEIRREHNIFKIWENGGFNLI